MCVCVREREREREVSTINDLSDLKGLLIRTQQFDRGDVFDIINIFKTQPREPLLQFRARPWNDIETVIDKAFFFFARPWNDIETVIDKVFEY